MTWQEPRFFGARIRDRRGWLLRAAMASLIVAAMLIAFAFDKKASLRRRPIEAIATSLVIGALLTMFRDVNIRTISITDEAITAFTPPMKSETWPFADIERCELSPSGAFGKPFGLLVLTTKGGRQSVVGVPAALSPSDVGRAIAGRGVRVETQAPPSG